MKKSSSHTFKLIPENGIIKSKRKRKRLERADLVCRELRFVMADNTTDWQKLYSLLLSWMRVSGKSCYVRPK